MTQIQRKTNQIKYKYQKRRQGRFLLILPLNTAKILTIEVDSANARIYGASTLYSLL